MRHKKSLLDIYVSLEILKHNYAKWADNMRFDPAYNCSKYYFWWYLFTLSLNKYSNPKLITKLETVMPSIRNIIVLTTFKKYRSSSYWLVNRQKIWFFLNGFILNFRKNPEKMNVKISVKTENDWKNLSTFLLGYLMITLKCIYVKGTTKNITNFNNFTINRILKLFVFWVTNVYTEQVINIKPNSDMITKMIIWLISNLLCIYDHIKKEKTSLIKTNMYFCLLLNPKITCLWKISTP